MKKERSLNDLNEYLFNALDSLNALDVKDVSKCNLEIKKCNAISQAGKTLIQSIGVQLMAQNSKQIIRDDLKKLINSDED